MPLGNAGAAVMPGMLVKRKNGSADSGKLNFASTNSLSTLSSLPNTTPAEGKSKTLQWLKDTLISFARWISWMDEGDGSEGEDFWKGNVALGIATSRGSAFFRLVFVVGKCF